jgi:hypothetical protein
VLAGLQLHDKDLLRVEVVHRIRSRVDCREPAVLGRFGVRREVRLAQIHASRH